MIITTYNSTEDMIIKVQELKARTKLKFCQITSNSSNEMKIRRQSGTFQFEEDTFSIKAEGICKNYHEVVLLRKFLQTHPQIRSKNIKFYDLYCTVIKNIDGNEIVNDEYENIENDYINYNDFIMPNYDIGIKPRGTLIG